MTIVRICTTIDLLKPKITIRGCSEMGKFISNVIKSVKVNRRKLLLLVITCIVIYYISYQVGVSIARNEIRKEESFKVNQIESLQSK